MLQWGRDHSAAERQLRQRVDSRTNQASMGPRPFGRGKCSGLRSLSNSRCPLQWGRDHSAAERAI